LNALHILVETQAACKKQMFDIVKNIRFENKVCLLFQFLFFFLLKKCSFTQYGSGVHFDGTIRILQSESSRGEVLQQGMKKEIPLMRSKFTDRWN